MNQDSKLKKSAKESAKDWPQWVLLASLGVEQAITNFGFMDPLFAGYGKYVLGLLWAARIGFVIYKASKTGQTT